VGTLRHQPGPGRRADRVPCLAIALAVGLAGGMAGTAAASTPPPPVTGANNGGVLTTLIRMLVRQGVITDEEGQQLLEEARAEAAAAAGAGVAGAAAGGAAAGAGVAAGGAAAGAGAAAAGDAVRVPYIPEPVRRQIREEVKKEVLAQAQAENWAAPNEVPSWVHRFTPYGDIRLRYEHDGFASNNASIVNFNAINTGQPYNVGDNQTQNPPFFNTDKDRNRFLLRTRVGVEAKVDDDLLANVRIASGNDNGPVSTNQTLGQTPTTGQGGNFSKYNIWLDQAYLRFTPLEGLSIDAGRIPNPFFHTMLLWDPDLNFDGAAVSYNFEAAKGIRPFFTVGGFPVYNTDFNFSTYDQSKQTSRDRYLMGLQAGLDSTPMEDLTLKGSVAYYQFFNMDGKLSSPCLLLQQSDQCDTDNTRQQYQQKGNTYFALRDIIPTAANNFGRDNQWQYFGLATNYKELVFTTKADLATYDPIHLVFDGEFVANLGFDRSKMRRRNPVNNIDNDGNVDGGNLGFLTRVTVGHPKISERWQWNVFLGYEYLESDAVVDGLTDSDFNLGGTNAQGYMLGGAVGIAKNTWLSARWYSTNEVDGPSVGIDVFQLDLQARF